MIRPKYDALALCRRLVATALLLVPLPVLAQAPPEVNVRADLAYGPDPQEFVDLCLPSPAGRPRPAVVVLHGGGWSTGSRKDPIGLCRLFARHGLVAAAVDYRLAGRPGGAWPAQIEDAQLAVRWLRAHASEFNVDPQRICAMGDSAGAHIAVFLAVLRRTLEGDRAAELAGVSSDVACAADNFGPVDLTVPSPIRRALARLAGSDDPRAQEATARMASPLALVGPTAAPMMIVQGDEDTEVPADQSVLLRDALRRAHVKLIYLQFTGGHEFKGLAVAEKTAIFDLEADFIIEASSASR